MEPNPPQNPIKLSELLVLAGALIAFFILDVSQVGIPVLQERGSANSSAQLALVSLDIISPNGGEKWEFGSKQEIKWQTNRSAPTINVYLISENGQQLFRKLLSKADNDGSEYWLVDMPPGSYKIQMQTCPGCSEGSNWDTSDGVFTVTENNEASIPAPEYPTNESLVFFSPRGGEEYYISQAINVRWFGGYENWQLTLTLIPVSSSGSVLPYVMAEGIQNDGKFEWTVPSNISMGNYYLKIECSNCKSDMNGISAYSFNYVTLKNY